MNLWEADHPYYCERQNYCVNDVSDEFETWDGFLADYKEADFDYNLLFRFDWYEGEDYDAEDFTGDTTYRNGRLYIFWMGQRKGLFCSSTVKVCRDDQPAVVEFLRPRLAHLMKLWSPLVELPTGDAP